VTGGIACLALGIALARLHPFTPTQVVVALIVTAVTRFLIPFFATDQGESRFQTPHGVIHMILAVLAFGGLVWAATGLWATLKHYPAWHGAKAFLTIVPWIMLGSVIAVVLAIRGPRLKPFFGAFERLFYLSSLAWLFVQLLERRRQKVAERRELMTTELATVQPASLLNQPAVGHLLGLVDAELAWLDHTTASLDAADKWPPPPRS
jgi:hypothetical protein